jgi:hypothetical protein
MRNAYTIFVGNPEGKIPLERSKRREENDIKFVIGKQGWRVWIGLIWLRIGTGSGQLQI